MDTNILEEFTSLYETLSFQETADRMNVSQSALTKHMHKLEDELGISLFDRSTRSVKLNEYSEIFYSYAEQIVRTAKEGVAALRDIANHNETRLHLAFTSTCSNYGIIELISLFSKMHPEYHLNITESWHACDRVLKNQCDFAFANDAIPIDEHLAKVIYKVDHLAAYLPADHPLAREDSIPISSLKYTPMIMHSRSNGAYHLDSLKFQAACHSSGFEPIVSAEASYTSIIMKLIREGQGVAALFRSQLPEDQIDAGVSIVDIDPPIETTVYLVYNPKHRVSSARRTFLKYLLQLEQMED